MDANTDTDRDTPSEPEVLFQGTDISDNTSLRIVTVPFGSCWEAYNPSLKAWVRIEGPTTREQMLLDNFQLLLARCRHANAGAIAARAETEALKGMVREYLKAGDDYAESFRNPWANASVLVDQHQKKCDTLDTLRAAVEPQPQQTEGGE